MKTRLILLALTISLLVSFTFAAAAHQPAARSAQGMDAPHRISGLPTCPPAKPGASLTLSGEESAIPLCGRS